MTKMEMLREFQWERVKATLLAREDHTLPVFLSEEDLPHYLSGVLLSHGYEVLHVEEREWTSFYDPDMSLAPVRVLHDGHGPVLDAEGITGPVLEELYSTLCHSQRMVEDFGERCKPQPPTCYPEAIILKIAKAFHRCKRREQLIPEVLKRTGYAYDSKTRHWSDGSHSFHTEELNLAHAPDKVLEELWRCLLAKREESIQRRKLEPELMQEINRYTLLAHLKISQGKAAQEQTGITNARFSLPSTYRVMPVMEKNARIEEEERCQEISERSMC